MPESVQTCFELSIHFSIFSRELFLVAVHGWFAYRQNAWKDWTLSHSYIPPIFFLENPFPKCQKFPIHEFFRSDVL